MDERLLGMFEDARRRLQAGNKAPVLISNIIAWPAAYFLMKNWLENFAFRIRLGLWPFLLAALFALMIASLTVLYHAYRASLKNPTESLRFE